MSGSRCRWSANSETHRGGGQRYDVWITGKAKLLHLSNAEPLQYPQHAIYSPHPLPGTKMERKQEETGVKVGNENTGKVREIACAELSYLQTDFIDSSTVIPPRLCIKLCDYFDGCGVSTCGIRVGRQPPLMRSVM